MNCYLCGSDKYHKREGKVRDDASIKILECDECGLVFLDKQNTGDEFYIQGNMHNQEEVYKIALRTDLVNDGHSFNLARFNFCKEALIGKTILDFGSGYAGFLRFAKDLAKSVVGVELEEQVKPLYEKYKIPLIRTLDEAKELNEVSMGGGFDLITSFHVIEHLQEPIPLLTQLATILKEDGKIIIEVPNADDALLTIYENKAFREFTYWSPHLYLYNTHTLRKLGEKAGLKVEFVKGIQRYPLSNTLYWLSQGKPAGQKIWGKFLDNEILQTSYEQTLASLGATDTLIAQFVKRKD